MRRAARFGARAADSLRDMDLSDDRSVFLARCARVAVAAQTGGLVLRKIDAPGPILEIERAGKSVTFPIVTDERTWKETTPDEAFYAVLVDARGWESATFDDVALAAMDAAEQADLPTIKRDLSTELGRVDALADVLGGKDALRTLYNAAGL